ncbi:MAG: hypothetical protein JWL85_690 [Candidatus Saccharibacteria bacterium]|nr:hypothetical protein [Candidatus Saccharibacteria bacterium]
MRHKLIISLWAFVVTCAAFAMFHLALIFIAAATSGNLHFLNPVEFLGLSVMWPHLETIPGSTFIFWAILINTFLIIYSCIHYRPDQALKRFKRRAQRHTAVSLVRNKVLDLLIGERPN